MKLNVVAPEFPPDIGGMQRYAGELTREIARRGHDLVVMTRERHGRRADIDGVVVLPNLKGVWFHDQEFVRRHSLAGDVWHIMNAAWSWMAAEVHTPAVVTVFGNDFLNPDPVAGLDIKGRLRLPFGSRLDYYISRARTRILMKVGLRHAAAIITISRGSQAAFLSRFPELAAKTTVIPLGVGAQWFSSTIVPKKGVPSFLTVARLSEPRKCIDVVLRALATLRSEFEFTYGIAGSGPLRAELHRLACDLGLQERVHFLGEVQESELAELYASSDLFILTPAATKTSIEGFGLVYLEANAAGTPVLATRTGGVEDAVKDGVNGILVDEPNSDAVAAAIRKVLTGEIRLDRARCLEFATRFRWSSTAERTIAVYGEVLRDSGGKA